MSLNLNADFNNSIANLIKMGSTVNTVKNTINEMIKADKVNGSKPTDTKPPYNKDMDYNSDGKVHINEQLRYYTEQISAKLDKDANSASNSSNSVTSIDTLKKNHLSGQQRINEQLISSAYTSFKEPVSYLSFVI